MWIIYKPDKNLIHTYSLDRLLWKISFDSENFVKYYKIKHSTMYSILTSEHGMENLAFLIYSICTILKKISDIGAIFANLRMENVIVTLDHG